jgi:hypothetical protein
MLILRTLGPGLPREVGQDKEGDFNRQAWVDVGQENLMHGESCGIEKAYRREIDPLPDSGGLLRSLKQHENPSLALRQKRQSNPLCPAILECLPECLCHPESKTASTEDGHGEAPGSGQPTST